MFVRAECSSAHSCEGLSKHAHFRNFGMAFLTLFRVATGDNWNGIMKVWSLDFVWRPSKHHTFSDYFRFSVCLYACTSEEPQHTTFVVFSVAVGLTYSLRSPHRTASQLTVRGHQLVFKLASAQKNQMYINDSRIHCFLLINRYRLTSVYLVLSRLSFCNYYYKMQSS